METIKQFTEQKIKEYVDILNIQMTKENANEITYGDKLAALGGLNMAISIMKLIDPTFEFDLVEEVGIDNYGSCDFQVGIIYGVKHADKTMIEKACQWIESYLFDIGFPDDWCRDSATMKSGKQRFLEAMEE